MKNNSDREFFPGLGYKGYCKFCNGYFYGKKDKQYHLECKIAHNNQKASEKNGKFKKIRLALEKNDKILNRYLILLRRKFVSFDKLTNAGFDFKYFSRQITLTGDNSCFIINEFSYSISDDLEGCVIYKTKDIDKSHWDI